MKKKFITLGIAFLMLFSLAACDLGNLDEYKETKKAELTAYVEALDADDYTATDWTEIQRLETVGKENIDAATTKSAVTTAFTTAKNGIGAILPKEDDMETISDCGRFSIKVEVDKITAAVGEVITVSVIFRNLTDQYITIEALDHIANTHGTQLLQGNLQPLIEIALLPYGRYPDVQSILLEGFTIILPAEAVVERAIEVSASEQGEHWILAGVAFFVGENRQERISVGISPIKVDVI